jgi:hypothetical protein
MGKRSKANARPVKVMKGRAYELLVQRLVEKLILTVPGLATSTVLGGATKKSKHRGASGYFHQIDVSVQLVELLVLIECKYWKSQVDTQAVLTMAARLADIQTANPLKKVSASIASTKRVDSGAQLLANYFGVRLETVSNEAEYAIRIGSAVAIGLVERVNLTDQSIASVGFQAGIAESLNAQDSVDAKVGFLARL